MFLFKRDVFANVDLSKVKSLGLVKHHGPSTLGIDTLLQSGGKIPDSFLVGCGIPDIWIDGLHDKLLIILSETSMESEWVKTEIRQVRKREEKEERHHDSFEESYQRLMKDFKPTPE